MPLDRDGPGALSRNERLILSLIRRRGPMPRAALAQLTGLSAQSITNLTRKLMMAGYLDAGAVVRGKVGQPSTPLALAPDGAWFLGLKIGRRLVELAPADRLYADPRHPYTQALFASIPTVGPDT